jgi:8-amino-7-oxononanoate synthase
MDGDTCPLPALVSLCEQYGAHLIIDEAHATGVIGEQGEGLVQACGLQSRIFARIHTFGKACGCHGAVVLGSRRLQAHLVNFARSLIYSTALSPHSVAAIAASYQLFPQMQEGRAHLHTLIQQFQQASLPYTKLVSETPIQGLIIPGNEAARAAASRLQDAGFDVRPILYPTVPAGAERLRIVLHAFNQPESLAKLVEVVGGF